MCEFFSCVINKAGTVYYSMKTMSHEEIISENNLTGMDDGKKFCRVEITNGDIFEIDLTKWTFKIDQEKPDWWNETYEKKCFEKFKELYCKYVFISQTNLIIKNNICYLKNSHAILRDNSRAELRDNSRAELRDNSYAELRDNSRAELRDNSHAELWDNSRAELRDNSICISHEKEIIYTSSKYKIKNCQNTKE